ncbi:MAG: hypothetical protein ACO3A4_12480 [Silvanigrellaceae bacterium]
MFDSVSSLFEYSGHHRSILLRAKDRQDALAIAAFHDVYGFSVEARLKKTLSQNAIDLVVMPSMSIRRVANIEWHPNDFWRHVLEKIISDDVLLSGVQIYHRFPLISRRRALKDSRQRRDERLLRETFHEQATIRDSAISHSKDANRKSISVLFLDDVLTSGGTLLSEFEFVSANLEKILPLPRRSLGSDISDLPPSLNAHILTLFRTPVSTRVKGVPS